MTRCLKALAAIVPMALPALLILGAAALPPAALAQNAGVRPFPADAKRGKLVITAPPEVMLDGRADRLSPGARIRDAQNQLSLSAPLVGKTLTVNYVRDNTGLIHRVWILTPAEARATLPAAQATVGQQP